MKAQLDALMSLLEQHIKGYESLAEILTREQAALLDLDLERLGEMTKAKETAVLKIKLLVSPLARGIEAAAQAVGLPPTPTPTLIELAGAAPKPWSVSLEKASLALARLKRGVARHNEANHSFVQEALELVSGSISILTGAGRQAAKAGYTAGGRRRQAPSGEMKPARLSREV